MGPYCDFCDRRCFVYLPWEELMEEMRKLYQDHFDRKGFSIDIIATCPDGQALEKERIGVCYDDIKQLRETRKTDEENAISDVLNVNDPTPYRIVLQEGTRDDPITERS